MMLLMLLHSCATRVSSLSILLDFEACNMSAADVLAVVPC